MKIEIKKNTVVLSITDIEAKKILADVKKSDLSEVIIKIEQE